MSETKELLKELDGAVRVLEDAKRQEQQLYNFVDEANGIEAKKWKGILWGGKGVFTLALLVVPVYIIMSMTQEMMAVFDKFVGLFLAAGIFGVFCIAKKKNAKLQAEIDNIEVKYNGVQAEIKGFLEQNRETLSVLPEDYWYYDSAKTIRDYIVKGRADSLKEAINMFEEELHRQRVENKQQEILEEQQRTTEQAAETAKQVRRIAFMQAADSLDPYRRR